MRMRQGRPTRQEPPLLALITLTREMRVIVDHHPFARAELQQVLYDMPCVGFPAPTASQEHERTTTQQAIRAIGLGFRVESINRRSTSSTVTQTLKPWRQVMDARHVPPCGVVRSD